MLRNKCTWFRPTVFWTEISHKLPNKSKKIMTVLITTNKEIDDKECRLSNIILGAENIDSSKLKLERVGTYQIRRSQIPCSLRDG